MEIIQERIEREFGLEIITTAPSVSYKVVKTDGEILYVDNPSHLPPQSEIEHMEEPIVKADIYSPPDYLGQIMDLCREKRGTFLQMTYLDKSRVQLEYDLPLNEIIFDFFDGIKSRTRGYASFEVPVQAAIGGKIIARETVKAVRKDVLAKCYGGDITRKKKLLEKQKEGKKRMRSIGSVEVPSEVFMQILKTNKD